MKESLITDINNYIPFLNSIGYYVTVHGKRIAGLPEYNVHNNPFCSFVKTNSAAREYRMNCWQKVCQKSSEGFFLGMCHAGIEEYVFFVNSGSFVRYGINKEKAFERIRALSQKYCLNLEELSAIKKLEINTESVYYKSNGRHFIAENRFENGIHNDCLTLSTATDADETVLTFDIQKDTSAVY